MSAEYPTASPTCGGTGAILPQERARASFSIKELQDQMGGTRRAQLIAQSAQYFQGPPFDDAHLDAFRSYEDLYKAHIERAAAAVKIARSNPKFLKDHMEGRVSMREMFNSGSLGIHFVAFLPFLETQASDEQKAKWLKGARTLEYVGAYAQTELGHGSNVRGLETTATYDADTDEFVIHSPTLSSIKWWPTAMYACTHGVVFAQLHIAGKNYGFHGFMVQFRDDKGRTMPGVEVGEIGPKIDGKNANIGYARFTHVRVPHFNMFSRNQQVTRDGTYVAAPPKLSKFKYIGMMTIRVGMVGGAYYDIARASTIAVRYLCIRQQGFKDSQAEDPFSKGESAVLDYKLHQYRVFKAVALAYMFNWNIHYVNTFLRHVRDGIMKGDESAADQLPELHATMSGMKAFCTTIAHREVEALRRSCGGQGFLRASGIGDAIGAAAEPVTAEGEHVILALQLARFLIKSVQQTHVDGTVMGSVKYLLEQPLTKDAVGEASSALTTTVDSQKAATFLVSLLRDRARNQAFKLEAAFSKAISQGLIFDEALNKVMILAYKAAECHTHYVLARNSLEVVCNRPESPIRKALLRLFELACLQQVWDQSGDFINILDENVTDKLLERINLLLEEIRPDAVALVDGFGIPDSSLKSTLGGYDGNVYEAIYGAAKQSPLNQSDTMIGWDKLSQVIDLDFVRQGMSEQRQGPGLQMSTPTTNESLQVPSVVSASPASSKL